MPLIRLYPPLLGVSENAPFSDQEPLTARDAENVVSLDPGNGRTRLTKRAGLSKYSTAQVSGSNKVRAIAQLVYNNLTIDYTALGVGNETQEWLVGPQTGGGGGMLRVSARGDLYVLEDARNVIYRFNSDGALISTIPLFTDDSSAPYWRCFDVDDDDSLYIGLGQGGTDTGGFRRLMRYGLDEDNVHRFKWALRSDGMAPNNLQLVMAVRVRHGKLHTLQQDTYTTSPGVLVRVYEDFRGSIAPSDVALEIEVQAAASGNGARGLEVNEDGEIFVAWGTASDSFLRKYDSVGVARWTKTNSVEGGGVGNAVGVRGQYVWSQGPELGTGDQWMILYTDSGDSAAQTQLITHAAGETLPASALNFQLVLVDAFNNGHTTYPSATAPTTTQEYQAYDIAGTQVAGITAVPAAGSLALPPTNPDYASSGTPPNVPEFVYLTRKTGAYYKYRLVTPATTTGSTRTFINIAVASDDIAKMTTTTSTNPTGGANVVDATARYVQAVKAFQKIYIADGLTYWVYDPYDDEVTEWVSTTSGTIPRRCSLIEAWRGRLVLSGDPDNRHVVYCSEQGDPDGWDFSPPSPSASQATWSGVSPTMKPLDDIINTLIPYSNDWLLAGCDHSISLLRGDPAAGGGWDLLTAEHGMAFGRPWCFGPSGELYFYSSRGGVCVLPPGLGQVERLSVNRIERDLQSVDLSTFYPRLAWDYRNEMLLVLFMPYGAGGTSVRHYGWSSKHDAWWPLRFGNAANTGAQPTAVFVSDGDDPDDRVVLFGCEDGYIRKLDSSIGHDVTAAGASLGIGSYVLIGPMMAEERNRAVKLRALWATLASQGNCAWEVYTATRPDDTLEFPAASGVLRAGYSGRVPVVKKGGAVWVKLLDAEAGERWAMESLSADVYPGDRLRAAD